MPEEKKFLNTKRIIITFIILIVLALSIWYSFSVYIHGGFNYSENETSLSDFGASLGVIGLISLILVYSRTLLKILVQKGKLSKRLEPLESENFKVESIMKKILKISNTLHPSLGIIAVASIFLHCYLTSSFMDNLLLQAALILLAWQGLFGLILKFRFTPPFLKKHSYLIHAQFFTGILLLILAGLGHLLLGD